MLTGAVSEYADAILEAQITRSQSHFTASQTRYTSIESAQNAYALGSFESLKTASIKYRDAAIKELVDNAETEKYLREKDYCPGHNKWSIRF